MKRVIFVLVVLLFLAGCSTRAPVVPQDTRFSQPLVTEEVVMVEEPEEEVLDVADDTAKIEESKQISTGGATDIKEEEPSIVSDLKCEYGLDGPEAFSFKLTNIENKDWKFSSLSYKNREEVDNPVVVLNALQITNGQLIVACGGKTLLPGVTKTCEFNLEDPQHLLVKKNLRAGLTPLGSENENTLSVRTTAHAAELRFICE